MGIEEVEIPLEKLPANPTQEQIAEVISESETHKVEVEPNELLIAVKPELPN